MINPQYAEFQRMIRTVSSLEKAGNFQEAAIMFDNAEQYTSMEGIETGSCLEYLEAEKRISGFRKIERISSLISQVYKRDYFLMEHSLSLFD